MKGVLFCGGQGTRLREFSESIPKPMVPIGYRPILWHLMKYYAHFGVDEMAMLWVLNLSDGRHRLLEIAERSGYSLEILHQTAAVLAEHGPLKEAAG